MLQRDLSGTAFDSINVRFGKNDYQHQEIEGDGEVGTKFDNQAWEGRAELTHQSIAGFNGNLGLQAGNRKFSAIGEEAFVPPVTTKKTNVVPLESGAKTRQSSDWMI